jgi:alcohol dehydrogenase (NADP+)
VIEIMYCGVCHSDIHEGWDYGEGRFPMVPGHEIVGRVSFTGSNVTRLRPGDTAGVGPMVGCDRTCDRCQRGMESYCNNAVWTYNDTLPDGTPTYGGYASRIVVNEAFAFPISANLPLERVAPLLCAGITTYSPLKRWKVGKGTRVGILGMGGLGHLAVKLAASMGADVTVLSGSKRKEHDARQGGAAHFAVTSDRSQMERLEASLDLILNVTPVPPDLTRFLPLLRIDGTFVQVGEPTDDAELPLESLEERKLITGSIVGGLTETQEMLDYCARRRIFADVEMIAPHEINDAWKRVLNRKARYRYVMDMSRQ